MGKKAAKKNSEPASAAKTSKVAKAPKSAAKKSDEPASLLSQEFYGKIDQFNQIYQEVNSLIEERGGSDAFNLADKEKSIAAKLEDECSKVLKSELEAAE